MSRLTGSSGRAPSTPRDGSGAAPISGDVAIRNDRIVAVGTVAGRGRREVSAAGMAVAPGFINMLSWATESLIADPRRQSRAQGGFPAARHSHDDHARR